MGFLVTVYVIGLHIHAERKNGRPPVAIALMLSEVVKPDFLCTLLPRSTRLLSVTVA